MKYKARWLTGSTRKYHQPALLCSTVRKSACRPDALFGGGDGKEGGGLGGLGNMANIMENMKKAQSLVQTEAAKVQEELSQCVPKTTFFRMLSDND